MITVAVSDLMRLTKMIPRVKYAVTLELKKVITSINVNCYSIDSESVFFTS